MNPAEAGRTGLEDVLRDPLKASLFGEFLKTQHADETLAFVAAVEAAVGRPRGQSRREAMRRVVAEFVADDARQQVGLSAGLQERLTAPAAGGTEEEREEEAARLLAEGRAEVTAQLEADKLNSFCASVFFSVLERGVASRAVLEDGALVERFLRLVGSDEGWELGVSKHAGTEVMRLAKPAGRAAVVQRERLFFPGVQCGTAAQVFYDDELHQPLYYPPCVGGHTLQHFGPDFKVVQTLYETKLSQPIYLVLFLAPFCGCFSDRLTRVLLSKRQHVVVAGIWRRQLPADQSHVVLRKTVPWPDELLTEAVRPGMSRTQVLMGGYWIQPMPGGCLGENELLLFLATIAFSFLLSSLAVTRLMQLKSDGNVSTMARNSLAAKASRMLSLARDYMAALPKRQQE